MTRTAYGSWTKFNPTESSVRHGIELALSAWAKDHNLDAIEREYREAINAKLADAGIVLVGDEFTGPVEECDHCYQMAPAYIAEALEQVNGEASQLFWALVQKHRKN
jgi:hypothetical protein